MTDKKKIRVAVVFGGRSGEHEISIISARSIMKALDASKYEVIPVGITRDGQWIAGGDPLKILEEGSTDVEEFRRTLLPDPQSRGIVPVRKRTADIVSRDEDEIPVDVVFPVLHGPMGEDGTIQGLLELAGIPYVGAGVLASAVGMDKVAMKMIFQSQGFPIPRYLYFLRNDVKPITSGIIDSIEKTIPYPVFVKPANLGSSVGISKAKNSRELATALQVAAKYDRKILVEQGIDAREIECAVLGNDDPVASIPGEILPCNEFYDYKAKYLDDRSQTVIPAPIPDSVRDRIMDLSIKAFKAIDCSGMARVDVLLEKKSDKIYLNEVNTIPGFTPISMYPKMWEASGIPYPELLDRLIQLAIERFEQKSQSRTSFDKADLDS